MKILNDQEQRDYDLWRARFEGFVLGFGFTLLLMVLNILVGFK
jgi:tetrahydromethanopterin S-methyltransferase subunit F